MQINNIGFINGSTYNRLQVVNKNGASYLQTSTSDGETFVYQRQGKLDENVEEFEVYISEKDYNFLGKLSEFDLTVDKNKIIVQKDSLKLTINQTPKHTFMDFSDKFFELKVKLEDLVEAAMFVSPKDSRPHLRGVIVGSAGIFAGDGKVIYRKNLTTGMPVGKTISIPTTCFGKLKTSVDSKIMVSEKLNRVAIAFPGEIYIFNLYDGNGENLFKIPTPEANIILDLEADVLSGSLKMLQLASDKFVMEAKENKLTLSAIAEERQVIESHTSFTEIPRCSFSVKYIEQLLKVANQNSEIAIGETCMVLRNADTICVAMRIQELV